MLDQHHRLHRSYMLAAGVLMAWEIVGVTPQKNEINLGGGTDAAVMLATPEAAVYIVIALLVYFAFRYELSWRQLDKATRTAAPARIDRWSSHLIAFSAILLWTGLVFGARIGELLVEPSADETAPLVGSIVATVLLALLSAGVYRVPSAALTATMIVATAGIIMATWIAFPEPRINQLYVLVPLLWAYVVWYKASRVFAAAALPHLHRIEQEFPAPVLWALRAVLAAFGAAPRAPDKEKE